MEYNFITISDNEYQQIVHIILVSHNLWHQKHFRLNLPSAQVVLSLEINDNYNNKNNNNNNTVIYIVLYTEVLKCFMIKGEHIIKKTNNHLR